MSENHAPIRITRRQTPGWRTPLCTCGCGQPARYVGRPSRWGNPYRVVSQRDAVDGVRVHFVEDAFGTVASFGPEHGRFDDPLYLAREEAVLQYRATYNPERLAEFAGELRGHDLSCWCPEGSPCHADTLIELINRGEHP